MKKWIALPLILLFLSNSTFGQSLNVALLDSFLKVLADNHQFMGSVSILENGRSLYTKNIGMADVEAKKPITASSTFRIGSVSKMFTACLVLKAADEHKLELNETLDKYFPSVANAKKITIQQLLVHRSGLHDFTDESEFKQSKNSNISKDALWALVEKQKTDFEPNTKEVYSNSNFVLLSFILEKAYHQSFENIFNDKIVVPLGLRNTYVGKKIDADLQECFSYKYEEQWKKEASMDLSWTLGAGNVVTNSTDLTLFVHALLSGKIISEKSLALMLPKESKSGMGLLIYPFFEQKGVGYAAIIDGFSTKVNYYPNSKLAVAITSNGIVYSIDNLMTGVLSCYYGKRFDIPSFTNEAINNEVVDLNNQDSQTKKNPFVIDFLLLIPVVIITIAFIVKVVFHFSLKKRRRKSFLGSFFTLYKTMEIYKTQNKQVKAFMNASNVSNFAFLIAFLLLIVWFYIQRVH